MRERGPLRATRRGAAQYGVAPSRATRQLFPERDRVHFTMEPRERFRLMHAEGTARRLDPRPTHDTPYTPPPTDDALPAQNVDDAPDPPPRARPPLPTPHLPTPRTHHSVDTPGKHPKLIHTPFFCHTDVVVSRYSRPTEEVGT
ncbi:hypothetical protein Y09_1139 [Brachybacterium sp. SW0106-09]|nr:hypothetical protein Y09_1139 [Brachybacterium sp. SW0106-09]